MLVLFFFYDSFRVMSSSYVSVQKNHTVSVISILTKFLFFFRLIVSPKRIKLLRDFRLRAVESTWNSPSNGHSRSEKWSNPWSRTGYLFLICMVCMYYGCMHNWVCKIIGTDKLLLYVAILHLVSLTSIQIFSLEVVFAHFFLDFYFSLRSAHHGGNKSRNSLPEYCKFLPKKCSQREFIHGEAFLPRWYPQNPALEHLKT